MSAIVQKYNEMTDGSKISMFIGIIVAIFLGVALLLKKFKKIDLFKTVVSKIGTDRFIIILVVLFGVGGGINFITTKNL